MGGRWKSRYLLAFEEYRVDEGRGALLFQGGGEEGEGCPARTTYLLHLPLLLKRHHHHSSIIGFINKIFDDGDNDGGIFHQ